MARVDDLENAIREHRASKTPRDWSKFDRRLYAALPEVPDEPAPAISPISPEASRRDTLRPAA